MLPPSNQHLPRDVGSFGDAKKQTAPQPHPATARRGGVCNPQSFQTPSKDPVAIHPGATPLMVIPSPAVSIATARIIPSIAAFAAPYAAEPTLLTSGPVTEVTFTFDRIFVPSFRQGPRASFETPCERN